MTAACYSPRCVQMVFNSTRNLLAAPPNVDYALNSYKPPSYTGRRLTADLLSAELAATERGASGKVDGRSTAGRDVELAVLSKNGSTMTTTTTSGMTAVNVVSSDGSDDGLGTRTDRRRLSDHSLESPNHQAPPAAETENNADKILYGIGDCPPWYLCVLLGLQHSLTCFGANLTVALVVAPAMCVTDSKSVSEILSTIFFVSGLVTLLQSTFGTRLPIVQGATFAFLIPTFSILDLPQWRCPVAGDSLGGNLTSSLNMTSFNDTSLTSEATPTDSRAIWTLRMREIQGAIIMASLFEILLGSSGLIGLLLKFIGPLAIAPTITLVGISLFRSAAGFAAKNWYIALGTSFLILLFSQYLRYVKVPCCFITPQRTCSKVTYPVFTLFPVILAIVLGWILCAILTVSGAIPNDPSHWSYHARTDVKIEVLSEASWFRFPYPFQWGLPTISAGSVLGMLAGVLSGAIESIGDYYACARLSGAPPPPIHAINRGILVEGFGCVLAGMWGTGSGTTSYSENVGTIGITKVASRRVIQVEAVYMMVFGLIGKLGAMLVTIPDPVVGGVFLVMFGIITAVGVSNLQFVDLNSSRNLCIFGFSLFFGLCLPSWLKDGDNSSYIKTGSEVIDQIFCVLLETSMFVGGVTGFILDNTIPGTEKERGMDQWRQHLRGQTSKPHSTAADGDEADDCYDLPCGMSFFRRWTLFRFIPLCPTFLMDVKGDAGIDVEDDVEGAVQETAIDAATSSRS